MNSPKKSESEITSLGSAPTFDADSLDIEELERRFEMTVLAAADSAADGCSCPALTSCGTYCTDSN